MKCTINSLSKQEGFTMKNRISIAFVVLALALMLVISGAFAALGADEYEDLQGVKLDLATMADQYAPYLKQLGKDFKEVSGITVDVNILGYSELYTKITNDFTTGSKQFDLATVDIVWSGEFGKKGWTEDLMPYIMEDYKELKVGDIPPAVWTIGQYKDKQVAFPMAPYANSLVYRKDLFEDPEEKKAFKEKYGYELKPPRTMKQLEDVAEFFTRPDENLYGLVACGARGPAVAQDFMEYMRMYGGGIFNDEGEVVLDSPKNLKALKFFVKIHQELSPAGSTSYWWDGRETAFRTGTVAMQSAWSISRAGYEDPKISTVVGKVALSRTPSEKTLKPSYGIGGWGIGINADISEKHKQAAWEFIKWITSTKIQKQWGQPENKGQPLRISVLTDTELLEKAPWYREMLKVFVHGDGNYRPRVPQYSDIQSILGLRVNQAITGELDAKTALEKAQKEVEELYE